MPGDDPFDVPTTVEELFEFFEARIDPAKTRGEHGTYRFEIFGAGSWLVTVDDGRVSVAAREGDADAVLRLDAETLAAIVRGAQSTVGAFLSGALAVEGDLLLTAKLDKFGL